MPQIPDIVAAARATRERSLTCPMPIRMPKMSMTMTEGEFSNWLVKVGDPIAKGQPSPR